MRSLIPALLMIMTLGYLTGCGGKDANAKPADDLAGTAKLYFILPDGSTKIRCHVNVASSDKVQINTKAKAGADKYRLNGTVHVLERDASSAKLFVRMMLYKNGKPDGSFDFTVPVMPGTTKYMNLNLGMGLEASM